MARRKKSKEGWGSQGTLALRASCGNPALQQVHFSPVRPISDLDLQNCKETNLCSSEPLCVWYLAVAATGGEQLGCG